MKPITTTLAAGLLIASLIAPALSRAQQSGPEAKDPKLTLKSVEAQVTALQTQVNSLQSSVSSVQTSVSTLQTSVSALQTTVGSLQTSLNSLQTTVTSLQPNFAVVDMNGALVRGSTSVVSTARLAAGEYQVVFNKDITGCEYNATEGDPGAGATIPVFLGVASLSNNVDGVFIAIFNPTANATVDSSFQLSVICP
ncbi:MAG: hypothetical protein ACLQAT_27410 [Candidatus Binataceae bacterium]